MTETFFTPEQQKLVVDAIANAELNTSGEIRVHIESICKEDVLDRAAFMFEKLKMTKTKLRNGVLFYLSVDDHKFAILGDSGINAQVPKNFWNDIKNHVITEFKKNNYASGLSEGIIMAGEQLKTHFPHEDDDVDELSNEISYGKEMLNDE